MITRDKPVKEFEIAFDRPQHRFTVIAETPEQAHRQLLADLRAITAELAAHVKQHKAKGQEHKPTQTGNV